MLPLARTAPLGVAVLLALAALAVGFGASATAAQRRTFTIEVSEAGFNPPACKLSRGDTVVFLNAGSTPRRVIWADPNGGQPFYDSGEIKPNALSLDFSGFENPSHWIFRDTRTAATVIVYTPTLSNAWDPNCTPDPALRPAPGPSIPPHDCATAAACVYLASLASDR